MMVKRKEIGTAVVGLGYWGQHVARVAYSLEGTRLLHLCDTDRTAYQRLTQRCPGVPYAATLDEVLDDPRVKAVFLVTPAVTHGSLAKRILASGRDLFVEKPLALSTSEARHVARIRRRYRRILMVGHLLLFHPAVQWLKKQIKKGTLGKIYYISSRRSNLGKVRKDENVIWSLAPHDISVFNYLLDNAAPRRISAVTGSFLRKDVADIAFFSIEYANRVLAHAHLSWLDPQKIRLMTIVGDRRMAVFDDTEPIEKIRLYDRALSAVRPDFADYADYLTLGRGGVTIPRLNQTEPLVRELEHFISCVKHRREPISGVAEGLGNVRILEAATRSARTGKPVTSRGGGRFVAS